MALMAFAFVPFYIKFLGIEAYGLVGFFTLLASLSTLMDLGLSTTLNREIAKLSIDAHNATRIKNMIRTFEVIFWLIGILIAIAIIFLSPYIASNWIQSVNLPANSVKFSVMAIGIALACLLPSSIYTGALMGFQKQVEINVINMIFSTLKGFGALLVLQFISSTIITFFCWQVVISLAQTLTLKAAVWKKVGRFTIGGITAKPRFDGKIFLSIWRFATGMSIISIQSILFMNVDKIILSKMLSLEAFGYYSLANVIASSLYFIISPFYSAYFPKFCELFALKKEEELKKIYHKSCQLLSLALLPAGFILIFFSQQILYLWTSDQNIADNTYLIVSLLTAGTVLNGLMNLLYALQLAYGKTKFIVTYLFILIGLIFPLTYFIVPTYGAIGAASVWTLLNALYFFIWPHLIPIDMIRLEKKKWYLSDIGLTSIGLLPIATMLLIFTPQGLSSLQTIGFLILMSLLTVISASLVNPLSRGWYKKIFQKYSQTT